MSNSGSGAQPPDPWRRPDEGQPDPGPAPSGWPDAQPTGWERPTSHPSSSSASSASSQSSAPEWPTYPPTTPPTTPPPTAPEPTRSFAADQPTAGQPGYQPYDPQAMPNYGSGTARDAGGNGSGGGYGSNPYDANPYDADPANPYDTSPYQAATPYQPYPGTSPYGAYQAYAAPVQHPQATTSFILGLLGLVLCPPVGIGGLVMGGRVRREIDASGGQLGGRGLATAGWVMGIISVVLLALYVVLIVFAILASVVEG